jgi:hypothetical protein
MNQFWFKIRLISISLTVFQNPIFTKENIYLIFNNLQLNINLIISSHKDKKNEVESTDKNEQKANNLDIVNI